MICSFFSYREMCIVIAKSFSLSQEGGCETVAILAQGAVFFGRFS